ncbi:ribonuclease Z [Egibacter rhizosphaerae]|uniref:Ribonuclease Z n=1 Tax=Egibacter rhizosphaerae TaxID=1670831 RepID=A0A411YI40_9ACTN|nr:ribonuclease Z [Egibacter rhizosphaerae]QBI20944.1 ribonuclease Z [Egibacter rhizosphaerae]
MTRDRALVVLGTSSRTPTRERNHNGYLLRWDGHAILFDPGEGAQRQLIRAGESPAAVDRVCITHLHGDHCLGLPGVVMNRSQHNASVPLETHAPAEDAWRVGRLIELTGESAAGTRVRPAEPGDLVAPPPYRLWAARLDHDIPTLGYRLEEPDGRSMDPEALAARGIHGPAVGRLQEAGQLTVGGRTVTVDEVSRPRPGQRVAFVMDTRPCEEAVALARDVDLLVIEATFLDEHAHLAERYGHLTARRAAEVAREAGARNVVLTHFSPRYRDPERIRAQAEEVVPNVHVAADLDRIPV